jgi:hypothetical protein
MKAFFNSAFNADRKFALLYLVQISRDDLNEKELAINSLFYDKIYDIILD